jgi:hypothetical protein
MDVTVNCADANDIALSCNCEGVNTFAVDVRKVFVRNNTTPSSCNCGYGNTAVNAPAERTVRTSVNCLTIP